MQKLQDSVFSIVKTTNLSPAVFSYLQPTDDNCDKTPLGGIFEDTKHGWLSLGPKFCVVDLRTGLKVAAKTFGSLSNNVVVTSVVELSKPLTANSQQLIISVQSDDTGMIYVLHVNGSQVLHCIQTEVLVTQLAVCDTITDGPLTCFDGLVMAGTARGEIVVFDMNRSSLIQALKDISQGYEHLVQNECSPTNLSFLPLNAIDRIEEQRELAIENDHHLAILLNENSMVDGQYIFRNPDGTVRMKAKRDHIKVTVLQYVPQISSLTIGFNFGAFQLWNMMTLALEYTSQVNVECLPVTHFAFQEPCDDPRAFCYLWVIFSVIDRFEEEEFPLAVMYSLTYQGKRMLSDTKYLYQDFLTAAIRFQIELGSLEDAPLLGGKCIACHAYSIKSTLGDDGEDNMLNICQLVWECWGETATVPMQYGMLLFDLDQWYKDQMPATHRLESGAFLSVSNTASVGGAASLHARLQPASLAAYSHPTRLEEHFYPNSLQYNCIFLNTSEALVLHTAGIQRQIVGALSSGGPAILLHPTRLYLAASRAGLAPSDSHRISSQEDQRRYLLSVALEARLSQFLKRCAHDWAPGTHSGVGCTLPFIVDWAWQRAIDLKETAKELTAPLFVSSALPDGNVVRSVDHCVQQLTQLTGLMDAILTKCCNLVVPDALSEMEERQAGIGAVSLYFQVVQWFLRVGLLPERASLPYPAQLLTHTYCQRRLKLNRLQDNSNAEENARKSCSLLYIDQLIEHEFGGDRIHQMWIKGGSEIEGLYPPPSLYSLLRLYLLPDIPEEHKHSLVLYLLVDYSMIYDDVGYEEVIRRLMQFPTMFGLSNTAIKATQAFWHLDHRDFDFALDQLQCLTGNTLHEWQHNVVLSSLLAQKKTQAALQYLHVRKPAPIHTGKYDGGNAHRISEEKAEEWQSCCSLYLSRGLVFEALDVLRVAALNATTHTERAQMIQHFYKGCRNTGNLSKLLQVTLLPFEEEVFIKYLQNCNDPQTSDLLIMYYIQQARYLEAERYNNSLKQRKPQRKDLSTSVESLYDGADRELARDALVEVACSALPGIASTVAHCALDMDYETHVKAPKPMSVFVQAVSPKNTFTYKSSFIQDTIENASETWMFKPKVRKGVKRALDIENTPFICTPKLTRHRSLFAEQDQSSTPPKRPRVDPTSKSTPRGFNCSAALAGQMQRLLDMPEPSTPARLADDRPDTPHSILKLRRGAASAASPFPDSDDEVDAASCHTHYSDTTNKHLRFTIPTGSESGSTPSPQNTVPYLDRHEEFANEDNRAERAVSSSDSYATTSSHAMNEPHPLESPPKKQATEDNIRPRKTYKDTVRARHSLSISANSSLSKDHNASIESIADIPITLINPRYSAEHKRRASTADKSDDSVADLGLDKSRDLSADVEIDKRKENSMDRIEIPQTPRARRSIRSVGESTPLANVRRSVTPERQDSPVVLVTHSKNLSRRSVTPERQDSPVVLVTRSRSLRSRSKTPELSPRSSPLASIPEQPAQEINVEIQRNTLNVPTTRSLRSRSKTPERLDRGVSESPKLEMIKESPTKGSDESPAPSPKRNLRSRSSTPEVEIVPVAKPSPRNLRSRSKTPEKLMSPKKDQSVKAKKSLSRIVLEANTFAKTKQTLENLEAEITESQSETVESTPMKTLKQVDLMDVTLSPIVNKSVLQSFTESTASVGQEAKSDDNASDIGLKSLPAFTTIHDNFEQSLLQSYESSVASAQSIEDKTAPEKSANNDKILKDLPINDTDFNKSVLRSYESSEAETSTPEPKETLKDMPKPLSAFASMIKTDFEKSVLRSYESSLESVSMKSSSLIKNSDVEMVETVSYKAKKKMESSVEMKRTRDGYRESKESEEDMFSESGEESEQSSEDNSGDTAESRTDEEEPSIDSNEPEVISIDDSDSENSIDRNTPIEIVEIEIEFTQENEQSIPTEELKASEEKEQLQLKEKQGSKDPLNEPQGSKDPLNEPQGSKELPLNQTQESLLTDDESFHKSDQSMVLHYSHENVDANKPKESDLEVKIAVESESTDITEVVAITEPKGSVDVVDNTDSEPKMQQPFADKRKSQEKTVPKTSAEEALIKKSSDQNKETQKPIETETHEQIVTPVESMETDAIDETIPEVNKPVSRSRRAKSTTSETKVDIVVEPKTRKRANSITDKSKKDAEIELVETPKKNEKSIEKTLDGTPKTSKKDAKSDENASGTSKTGKDDAKSVGNAPGTPKTGKDDAKPEENAPGTPKIGKDAKSDENAPGTPKTGKKDAKSDENASDTPTRRRGRTPAAELRTIVTRRVSRELAGVLDDSIQSLDDLTPKRRSRRKNDDNESVASESSVLSNKSEVEVKPRKGRKSVLPSKPDLGVIPEVAADDKDPEYTIGRRTSRQPKTAQSRSSRRQSAASVSSVASETDEPFDVQPIDRITLLNKNDFEGAPDTTELHNVLSQDSVPSDDPKQTRSRLTRAASEARTTPRAAKINRRFASVDVEPSESPGSPGRSRRASFTRACEALAAPPTRGRRTSTDLRKIDEGASPALSEEEACTPPRRTRRASTHSNTSQHNADTPRRTKKMPVLTEDKESNK